MEMLVFRIVLLSSALACLVSGKIFLKEPNLYYECENTNTIVITGTNGSFGSVHAVGTPTSDVNSTCTVKKSENNKPNVTFTITNCRVTSTIKVYVMEEKQGTDNIVLGGKGLAVYELKCSGIQKGGTNITKVFNLTEGDNVTVHPHPQLEVNLSMEVTDTNSKSLNSSSVVWIGDELHLIISGNNGFRFAAQSCKAAEAINSQHEKNLTHNGMTYDPFVISNFTGLQNSSGQLNRVEIRASLYAFHFVGSDSIVITCTITVCESNDDTCLIKKPGNGRRRRATGVKPYTQSLQTTLRVVDMDRKVVTTNEGSKASGASIGSTLWLVPMISCVLSGICQFRA